MSITPMAGVPAAELRGVVRDHGGGNARVRALDGVSMAFPAGSWTAVMGPSGSGKSTFMNLVGCLDTPTSGRYDLDGEDVARLDRDRLAEVPITIHPGGTVR